MISNEIQSQVKCPTCISKLIISKQNKNYLICNNCHNMFYYENNFVGFIEGTSVDQVTQRALETWGNDLHTNSKRNSEHLYKLIDRFPSDYQLLSGNVLEIGFGKGGDLFELSKNTKIQNLYGIDLGANARNVASEFIGTSKVKVIRANAQSLPFDNDQFDAIYSYGVIHHTKDPTKTIKECNRVLKRNGLLLSYVYSNHTNNLFKRIGIVLENLIMNCLIPFPYQIKLVFCITITPIAWLTFTVPAKILKAIGFKRFSETFPLNWGTTPFSILPDIKDRFLASINHRYSKTSIKRLLKSEDFEIKNLVEDYSGIYIAAEKNI